MRTYRSIAWLVSGPRRFGVAAGGDYDDDDDETAYLDDDADEEDDDDAFLDDEGEDLEDADDEDDEQDETLRNLISAGRLWGSLGHQGDSVMTKRQPIVGKSERSDENGHGREDHRESVNDRRADEESVTGLERRRGPGRRLSDFSKSAEEGELTQEQFLFVVAIDAFKKANDVWYPTWTDVLEVFRLLGYRKTMPSELELRSAEDWREPPDAPSDVRTDRQNERDRSARGEAA